MKHGLRIMEVKDAHREDSVFLARLKAGGAEAAALVFDRYESAVNRIVWHMLGADPDHDDIVHEVFLVALKKIGRVKDPEKIGGWIRAVTVNQVRQEMRKRKVRRLFWGERAAEHLSWTYDDEAAQTLQFLYGVLRRMEIEEQTLITLRHLDECTLKETAETVGCSLATVKRRLRRAEQRFRRLSEDQPGLREFAIMLETKRKKP